VTRRRARLLWWLPSKSWSQDGWRWRVAALADKLPQQCWASLVDWALRRHEDDPDTPLRDLARRVPFRPQDRMCHQDMASAGACYCGRLMTSDFRAQVKASRDGA